MKARRTWRNRVAGWLRAVATWLAPPPGEALATRARMLTAAQEAWPDRSGEAKRHQVYAQLLKEFAETPKRQIARAIEDALEE